MENIHPETGVRYGVIAVQSLDPDLASDLMHGPDAVDLTYREAYADAKDEAVARFEQLMEEAELTATETDPRMSGTEREAFVEKYMDARDVPWDYVDQELEKFASCYQCDEPVIEGIYEGVSYQVSWLGGAPHLWVLGGPRAFCRSLCSPCIPNAADLDSGFVYDADDEHPYECYGVPADWLAPNYD